MRTKAAPVTRADETAALLKLGRPHMEGKDEINGLRFWAGDPTVRQSEEILGQLKTYYARLLYPPIRYNVRLSESPIYKQTILGLTQGTSEWQDS